MIKRTVYESRMKLILFLVVTWGFLILSIVVSFVAGIIIFGVAALIVSYPLYAPGKRLVFIGSKEHDEQIRREVEKCMVDSGIFQYTEWGFDISLAVRRSIEWSGIRTIIAYKADLIATDEICLMIYCDDDFSFQVTESTMGWFMFTKKLKEIFPEIKQDWDIEIVLPPFAVNLTLLYDREKREPEEVMKQLDLVKGKY